jgi:hypothetical protein
MLIYGASDSPLFVADDHAFHDNSPKGLIFVKILVSGRENKKSGARVKTQPIVIGKPETIPPQHHSGYYT